MKSDDGRCSWQKAFRSPNDRLMWKEASMDHKRREVVNAVLRPCHTLDKRCGHA